MAKASQQQQATTPCGPPSEGGRPAGAGHAVAARLPAHATLDADARQRLYRLAYRFAWNHADAEDAVQSAVVTAWQKSDQLREGGKWWTWLCSIVVQRCRELRRKESTRQRHAPAYARAAASAPPSESEAAERVRMLLPQLQHRQYEVIVLRHLQGMSFDEIGEVLGISPATARVHAQTAREALRDLMLAGKKD